MAELKSLFDLLAHHAGSDKRTIAWRSATPIPGYDPEDWRRDCDGRVIRNNEYGQLSEHGWEIDHAIPLAANGPDTIFNLRARHWRGNRSAGGELGALAKLLQR